MSKTNYNVSYQTRRPLRLAYLVSHPIQYQVPLLRRLSLEPDIDLTVFFCSDLSIHSYLDIGFQAAVKWDIPLLGGYAHQFIPCLDSGEVFSFLRPLNHGFTRRFLAGKFDALWVHGYGHWLSLYALALARMLKIRTMLRTESTFNGTPSTASRRFIRAVYYPLLRKLCSQALAIGTRNRDHWIESIGFSEERISWVPYAVDNQRIQDGCMAATQSRESLGKELGLDPVRPVILFASKFIPRKRAGDLLDAYIQMSSNGIQEPRPYLLFIGDGEQRNFLEKRAEDLRWSSIHFLGFRNQTELPGYFDLCDVFVLPSVLEPWGLVVNEAMNAGKAIIVSDQVGCAPDLVRNGENGYVYPAGDCAALKNAIEDVLQDPSVPVRMGTRSLDIIQQWDYESDVHGLRQALGLPSLTPSLK